MLTCWAEPHVFGNYLHYTQEPCNKALFLFMETIMLYLPILLFVSYHLFLSGCRIMAKAPTDRKVVDRTHLPHLLLQERHYTRVLLGLLPAFYCPLYTHGCFSCVKYFFWFKNLGMLHGAFTPLFLLHL